MLILKFHANQRYCLKDQYLGMLDLDRWEKVELKKADKSILGIKWLETVLTWKYKCFEFEDFSAYRYIFHIIFFLLLHFTIITIILIIKHFFDYFKLPIIKNKKLVKIPKIRNCKTAMIVFNVFHVFNVFKTGQKTNPRMCRMLYFRLKCCIVKWKCPDLHIFNEYFPTQLKH